MKAHNNSNYYRFPGKSKSKYKMDNSCLLNIHCTIGITLLVLISTHHRYKTPDVCVGFIQFSCLHNCYY